MIRLITFWCCPPSTDARFLLFSRPKRKHLGRGMTSLWSNDHFHSANVLFIEQKCIHFKPSRKLFLCVLKNLFDICHFHLAFLIWRVRIYIKIVGLEVFTGQKFRKTYQKHEHWLRTPPLKQKRGFQMNDGGVCFCLRSVESSDVSWKRKKSGGIKIICQSEMRDFSAMAFITDHVNSLIEQWFPGQWVCFC